jgi:hypothetical protein
MVTTDVEANTGDNQGEVKVTSPVISSIHEARQLAAASKAESSQTAVPTTEDKVYIDLGNEITAKDQKIEKLYKDASPDSGTPYDTFKDARMQIDTLKNETSAALKRGKDVKAVATAMAIIKNSAPLSLRDKSQWGHIAEFVRAAPDILQDPDTAQAIFKALSEQRYHSDLDPNTMKDEANRNNFERWGDDPYSVVTAMSEHPVNIDRKDTEIVQNWKYMHEGSSYRRDLARSNDRYDQKTQKRITEEEANANTREAAYSALPERIKTLIPQEVFYASMDATGEAVTPDSILPVLAEAIQKHAPALAGKEFFVLGLVQDIGLSDYTSEDTLNHAGRALRAVTGEQTVMEYRNSNLDTQWHKELQIITRTQRDGRMNRLFSTLNRDDINERQRREQAKHDAKVAEKREEERLKMELEKANKPVDPEKPQINGPEEPIPDSPDLTANVDNANTGETEPPVEPNRTPETTLPAEVTDKGLGGLLKRLFPNKN